MGEVYRGRDTRLERDIALTVSAAQFSERFEREAKIVATLNHPNICTLHDVGPNFLVMKLIEGPTLGDRSLLLARRPVDRLRRRRQAQENLGAGRCGASCVSLGSHWERCMTKIKSSALMLSCTVLLASCLLLAQVPKPGEYPLGAKPSPMMNFFVTSEPIGDGGHLGGLGGC